MSSPPAADDERFEALLADAIAAHEAGGEAALATFVATHTDVGGRLAAAIAEIRRANLLTQTADRPPQHFGEFRVLGRLGAGGMGVVYLAEQATLGREVAVKVVRPELLLFEGARERFRREIEAVARLEHPAIVPILATGEAQGVPYYAMPRLRGCSAEVVLGACADRNPGSLAAADLTAMLANGGVACDAGCDAETNAGSWWRACVRRVLQAATGIHHAHVRGVLHRDLKPSNLMLLGDGRTVVLDFGLAHVEGDARLTQTGSAAGSPAYMAPEQLRAEPADERTDVYGLGATLHALLDGRPPFPLGDPQAMRARIVHGERQPIRHGPTWPPELALVLATAMDVDRGRRYPSAAAFAEDLQAVLDGRPIRARALPLPVRIQRFTSRHRAFVTALVVALLFLAATPALLLWQSQLANARLRAAVDVSLDAVDSLLARVAVEKVRNQPAMQDVAIGMLQDALALFDRLAANGEKAPRLADLRRRARSRLAHLHFAAGDLAAAESCARQILAEVDVALPPDVALDAGSAHSLLAVLALRTGDRQRAQDDARAADAMFALAADDPKTREDALTNRLDLVELRASLLAEAGDPSGAIATLRHGIAAGDVVAHSAAVVRRLVALQIDLATRLDQAGASDEALHLLDDVVDTFPDLAASESGWPVPRMQVAQARHAAGTILAARDPQAGLARWLESATLLDGLVRDYPDDASVRRLRARTTNQIGVARNTAGDFGAARAVLETGLGDIRRVVAQNPKDEAARTIHGNLLRATTTALRGLADWTALENVARELGRQATQREWTCRAARELLRCAEAIPVRAERLRDEALALLERASAEGLAIDADDPLYAPLRENPRFRAIGKSDGGR